MKITYLNSSYKLWI